MKILFITNLIPYPLDNGGKIKTYNTLQMMKKENKIDLFSFYESDKEKKSLDFMKEQFDNVYAIKKPLTTNKNKKKMLLIAFKSLFRKYPFVLLKYIDKRMKKLLKENINVNKYDLIYIDHLQLGVYFNILKEAKCKIYLDEHNCESQILKRKMEEEKSFLKKVLINIEYKKLKQFENNMLKKVDKVIVLSNEDKKCLIEDLTINEEKFVIVPIPIKVDYTKDIGSKINDEIKIMFLGTLTWFPNAQGIEWFIDNVIPRLEKENIKYKLYIVGKDPSDALKNKSNKNDNIIVTGYVESIDKYIEKCDIMIVPIFIGSGMRVKILEGLGKNIPIITTKIGAEGINIENGKNILIADNEDDFVKNILKLKKNSELYNKLQVNGSKLFNELYSIESICKHYRTEVLEMGEMEKYNE